MTEIQKKLREATAYLGDVYFSDARIIELLALARTTVKLSTPPQNLPVRWIQGFYAWGKDVDSPLKLDGGRGDGSSAMRAAAHFKALSGATANPWDDAEVDQRIVGLIVSAGIPAEKLACIGYVVGRIGLKKTITLASGQFGPQIESLIRGLYYMGKFYDAVTEHRLPEGKATSRTKQSRSNAQIAQERASEMARRINAAKEAIALTPKAAPKKTRRPRAKTQKFADKEAYLAANPPKGDNEENNSE